MTVTGVPAGRHRRALDSVVLEEAVATQDAVTQLIVRAARCTAHDYAERGKPRIAWGDEAAWAALVSALVTDACNLLEHLPEQQTG